MDTVHQTSGRPGASTSADTNTSERLLEARLNNELSTVKQDPSALTSNGLSLSGGAGGYTFSPSALDDVIAGWHEIRQRAEALDETIHIITTVTAAAADEASTGFTDRAREVGTGVQASHASLKNYAATYVAKLQAARHNYGATEDAVTGSLSAIAEGLGR